MEQEIINIAEQIRKAVLVKKIYLFGSYARGTQTQDSDYDFFVIIPDDSMRPIEAMQEIYRKLAIHKMRTPIDVIASTEKSFNERREEYELEKAVEKEGVLLYENQSDLQMV